MFDNLERTVREQERRDRREAERHRPRPRKEPPDEAASRRTPSLNEVMHRAEALAAISPPVDAPPTPINGTGKIESMARMGGDVPVFGSLSPLGPTAAGEDIGRQAERVLDPIDGLILDRRL